MEKNSMELLPFPPELNYIVGNFQCYTKYNFIYIFLNATVLVKKPPKHHKTKNRTLKCQLIQKSAKHRKEPGTATVQLQPMKLNHCISLYPFLE